MITAIPETPTARAAADMAAAAAPPYLLNHSYRTYLFGCCLVPSSEIDNEAAFVAAMIHDLGLTDAYSGVEQFSRVGADLACSFLESKGWELDRIYLVEQAILRHTKLAAEREPVYRVVQSGAAVDVAGLGYEGIESGDLTEIMRAFPRLDFATSMRQRFLEEATGHPDGVFAELERTVALSGRFITNPIDSLADGTRPTH